MILRLPEEEQKKAERRRLIRKGALLRKPLTGPLEASIILTYACNYRCIFCALESEAPAKKGAIAFELLKRLISDLAALNTEQVSFTGGGEPMLYNKIDEAVELVRKNNMACSICTNASLLNEERIKKYAELGVHLSVSINAADPETYPIIHPRTTSEDFVRITNLLRKFTELAHKLGTESHSFVSLNFVVHSKNFDQIYKMYQLSKHIGAHQIQFRLIQPRIVHKHLFLSDDQLKQVREQITRVEEEAKSDPYFAVHVMEILRSSSANVPACDTETNLFCATSEFNQKAERVPCLEGYIATYIDSDGIVFPCCMRSVSINNHYMGDLHEQNFFEIWQGENYQKFRTESFLVSVDSQDPRENSCAYCPKASLFQRIIDEWSYANYLYYYDHALKEALEKPIPRVLPPKAFKVEFISHTLPKEAIAGSTIEVDVEFKNTSEYVWTSLSEPLGQAVGIGYHLLDRWGKMLKFDNNPRSYLKDELAPNETAKLSLKIELPKKAGKYIIEFALIQEKVAWFEELGAKTLRVPIKVKRP